MDLSFILKTKKIINILKIVSVFLIIRFLYTEKSFAQDSSTQKIDDMTNVLHFIVSFLSRGRALLATLAGKLMSNDLIYGSFMHLDIFLWKIWNIMKNFANYTLGFLFLYMVIKSIITKEGANDIIKKKITGFIIAGVLIQASRFLLGAIIDISTITVTAIGAIPGQIIQSNMGLQKNLAYINALGGANLPAQGEIITGIVMTFDPNANLKQGQLFIDTQEKALDKPITQDNYLDMILPSHDTISGPLIFFGTSIFQFQDYAFTNPETKTSRKRLMEFGLSLIIILMYSLAMLALVIINFFRIFFLWIIIMFSPFIILLGVMGKMGIIKTDKMKGLDKISASNVIKLIFKPVIFIAYISIMMIFVIGVRAILIPINGGEVKINDEITMSSSPVGENSYNSSIKSEGIFNFTVNGAKKSIADLMVCFITLFLMRFLIKIAVSKGSGVESLDKKLENLTKRAENLAGQLPIVPIAKGVGVNSIIGGDRNSLKSRLLEKGNIATKMQQSNEANLNKLLGIPGIPRNTSHTQTLQNAINNNNNSEAFWTASNTIAQEIEGGLHVEDTNRNPQIESRWEKNKDKNQSGWTLNQSQSFDDFLNANAEIIHKKMGGSGNVNTYNDLKKQRYGEYAK